MKKSLLTLSFFIFSSVATSHYKSLLEARTDDFTKFNTWWNSPIPITDEELMVSAKAFNVSFLNLKILQ